MLPSVAGRHGRPASHFHLAAETVDVVTIAVEVAVAATAFTAVLTASTLLGTTAAHHGVGKVYIL